MDKRNAIEIIRNKISTSRNITMITGSGMSIESGIPSLRGKNGLWKSHRAEDLASPKAFYSNPSLVWEWYNWRREIIRNAKPNKAHYACVDLEQKLGEHFYIITQNIDELHQKAGNKNILEVHGSVWKTRCTKCGDKRENRAKLDKLPKCQNCGGLLRPDVIWYGEAVTEEAMLKAFELLFASDVVIIVGTSGIVYPVAQFSSTAKDNGSYLIEINTDETPHSDMVDLSMREKAGDVLPLIV